MLLKKHLTGSISGIGVPGTWWIWKLNGSSVIMVSCPKCKKIITLSPSEHMVADDGAVTPSCVCPTSHCDFHAHLKLQGWKPEGVAT